MKRILLFVFIVIAWFSLSIWNNWEPNQSKDTAYPQDIPIPIQITMERSCYDCHSNHTRIPWYGKVFPVNIYLKNHVDEAKESMNLSDWDTLSPKRKAKWSLNILEKVEEGSMPPTSYKLIHWGAILHEEELWSLKDWQDTLEKIYESSKKD